MIFKVIAAKVYVPSVGVITKCQYDDEASGHVVSTVAVLFCKATFWVVTDAVVDDDALAPATTPATPPTDMISPTMVRTPTRLAAR